MHYHIDMITHGPPLLNQSSALVGTSRQHYGRIPPFCNKWIELDLNLDGPLYRQRRKPLCYFPAPYLAVVLLQPLKNMSCPCSGIGPWPQNSLLSRTLYPLHHEGATASYKPTEAQIGGGEVSGATRLEVSEWCTRYTMEIYDY